MKLEQLLENTSWEQISSSQLSLWTWQLPTLACTVIFLKFQNSIFFKYLQIYANIVSIGESDFEGCSSLETISYSSTLNFISPKAFKDCTSLKEFKYPDTLDYVVTKCFVGCTAVKSVELPPMIKRIEEFAFYGCICLDILIVKGQL